MHAFYNDEDPREDVSVPGTYAHAKGILNFDKEQGFWVSLNFLIKN